MKHRTTFDIVGPDGRRVTIAPRSATDTIAQLATALGHRIPSTVSVDGHPVAPGRRLVDVPMLRAGARIELAPRPSPALAPDSSGDAVAELAVVAGPACRSWSPLGAGRHAVGRSPHSAVRLDDPALELHHAVLDVDADGGVRFTQLTGRVAARLDGAPCRPQQELPPGAHLEIGSSLVTVRPAGGPDDGGHGAPAHGRVPGSIVAGPDPWRRIVRRGPPVAGDWDWPEIVAPPAVVTHPAPPVTGLIGSAMAMIGALVVATVLGQVMFALFSLIGGAAALVTWIVGIGTTARRRRRAGRDRRAAVERFHAELAAAIGGWRGQHADRFRTITQTLGEVERLGARLWERRVTSAGPLWLTVGLGAPSVLPAIEGWSSLDPDLLAEVDRCAGDDMTPVAIDLAPGEALAVQGDPEAARAVVRAVLVDLVTWSGPADWQLLVVTRRPERWAWAAWLPHAVRPDDAGGVVTAADVEEAGAHLVDDRLTVLVTDDVALFDARTGPARRLVSEREAIVLAPLDRDHSVPALYERVLRLGSTGWAEWVNGPPPDGFPGPVRVAGIDEAVAGSAARTLASLVDPEDDAAAAAALPVSLRFGDLDQLAADVGPGGGDDATGSDRDPADVIVQRWQAAGGDPPPCAPIGVSVDGVIDIDLVRDGPHGLIAGTTGAGKSELLRTLVLALATRCSPDHLTFVLVDYKGGATFDACARLPHVVGVVTDLDGGGAQRSLVSMEAELRRREMLLRRVAAADLTDYRTRSDAAPLPRLVVVIDEFAALTQELPGFVGSLIGIAQRGRSLGVHLLLATQRPAGVVSDDIRANTNLRLALRLHDAADGRDVVGDELPASLSRRQPGRAVLRLGPGELVVFQAACCSGPHRPASAGLSVVVHGNGEAGRVGDVATPDGPTELSATVDAICRAADRLGIATPHRPWVDPLPALLDAAAIDAVVGVPAGEHDAVGVVDDPAHQRRRALRWDAGRGNLALVGPLGSGVTSTLVALAAAQCRTAPPSRLYLYAIDAVGDPELDRLASIAHCGAVVRAGDTERLHRLLAWLADEIERRQHVPDPGHRTVLLVDGFDSLRASLSSIDRVETLALLERILADGAPVGVVVALGGADPSRVDIAETWTFCGTAQPGRITVRSTGLEGQLGAGAPGLARLPMRGTAAGAPPVETLGARVDRRTLGASWMGADHPATAHLVVGRGADGLEDVAVAVPAGDHVLVGGPSGAGKTTALRLLTLAWRDLHPGGAVVGVDRRRPLGRIESGGPTLVVVDDAERVDDPHLSSLVAAHRVDVTVIAAARVEAVRALYGHWTREVARSRCGIVLISAGDIDGELLGANLPTRTMIPPRPGLAWIVDRSGQRLTQLALADR